MESNELTGTLTSGNGIVELVKKCVVCNGTLLVEKFEAQKDRHEMCGWTYSKELRLQAEERRQVAEWLAR
jgi:hypothetical protein